MKLFLPKTWRFCSICAPKLREPTHQWTPKTDASRTWVESVLAYVTSATSQVSDDVSVQDPTAIKCLRAVEADSEKGGFLTKASKNILF